MRRAHWVTLLISLLVSGCFVARVIERNLVAPPERRVANRVSDPRRGDARIAALWIGHATVLVQLEDKFVLTDPLFTHTLAQVSPRLVEPGLDTKHLPPLAAVVVSHMHFDHLSFGSLDMLEQHTPVVLVPPGVRSNMPRYGFEIRELERWASYEANGLRVTAVPVQHVGGRVGVDAAFTRRAFTGYVFEYRGLSVYFGGDTAYWPDAFRATRARFPALDVAILPICPEEPREFMSHTHVDPGQALDAFRLLGAKHMIAVHYDTFINSDDPVGRCSSELRRQMRVRHLSEARVHLLAIGEQRVLIGK
jgi:L-ascorbate metabolism protein UlaG (beta-lactamase superfamily)